MKPDLLPVEQYHEESGKPRTVISLGSFQQAEHLAWLAAHPKKRPMPVGSRKQVSLFYSGGDVCDSSRYSELSARFYRIV